MLVAWLCSLAWAESPATPSGQAIIEAENALDCTLAVDGTTLGKLPIHMDAVTGGAHSFSITCPDGRTASAKGSITLVPGGIARLTLKDLPFTAPTPEVVTGPIPTYVVISNFPNKKVRIDGSTPFPLPYRATLTVGPHSFIVVEPNGTEKPAVTRNVVSKNGQAVVNLD